EAFLSQKPVITATDAGGPLDIVRDVETGLVVAPTVEDVARACTWLREHSDDARKLGRAGREVARAVTWDACIERLLAAVQGGLRISRRCRRRRAASRTSRRCCCRRSSG